MPIKIAVALVLMAVVAAGCGGQSEADKAFADVCTARNDITKQVDQLQGLTVTTATASQVTDGLQAIRDDLSTIAGAQDALSEQRRTEVQDANDTFAASVKGTLRAVGTTVSIDDASTRLKGAFDQLAASYTSSFRTL